MKRHGNLWENVIRLGIPADRQRLSCTLTRLYRLVSGGLPMAEKFREENQAGAHGGRGACRVGSSRARW